MQGVGNDFIILESACVPFPEEKLNAMARELCTRRTSLGGDALILLSSSKAGCDLRARFFNADGSEAEMCGNGARCIARYAYEHKLAGPDMMLETMAGTIEAHRLDERTYKVLINSATFVKHGYMAEAGGEKWDMDYVELGDPPLPHAVVRCDNLDSTTEEELRSIGHALRNYSGFPKGANVNFYKLIGPSEALLKTYERGVEDFTLACGTGSVSTALILTLKGLVAKDKPIVMRVLGGILQANAEETPEGKYNLWLIGDTKRVVCGEILDEDLFRKDW